MSKAGKLLLLKKGETTYINAREQNCSCGRFTSASWPSGPTAQRRDSCAVSPPQLQGKPSTSISFWLSSSSSPGSEYTCGHHMPVIQQRSGLANSGQCSWQAEPPTANEGANGNGKHSPSLTAAHGPSVQSLLWKGRFLTLCTTSLLHPPHRCRSKSKATNTPA